MLPPVNDRRMSLILNPFAGIGSAKYLQELIMRELKGLGPEVHVLQKGEDIRPIVADALSRGSTDVIAAGGDGTVSAVAGSLAGTDATLGIIPTGTANMLARELGIPLSVALAARLIRRGLDVVRMDAMATHDRSFVYQVVIGAGSEVLSKISRAEKRMFGRTVYALAGLRLMTEYHPIRMTGSIDGREVRMWTNQVMIANAGIMGLDPFRLGPHIRLDDGTVEVIAMHGRTRLEFLNSGLDLMFGNYSGSHGLRYYPARREIHLETEPASIIKADGEFIGRTPLHLRIMPGAVRVYAPLRTRRG
jgi:YegS/Rv2252/BmrU family lipid kinase